MGKEGRAEGERIDTVMPGGGFALPGLRIT